LPDPLPALLVQLVGLVVAVIGCVWLWRGRSLGLVVVLTGTGLVVQPLAYRLPLAELAQLIGRAAAAVAAVTL
jgi:hypothetical protein